MSWRAFRLHEMHKRIDDALRAEQRSPVANPFRVTRLKKIKLALKDRLAALARNPGKA